MQPLLSPGVACSTFFCFGDSHNQTLDNDPALLTGVSANTSSAPIGVNPQCGIPKVGTDGSLGNVANIVACGVSIFAVLALIIIAGRRKAAVGEFPVFRVCHSVRHLPLTPLSVGRVEIQLFFGIYLLTLPFQLLTTGSVLQQGSTVLVAFTAIQAGLVAALFWVLLANSIVATQVVEDGTLSSLVVCHLAFASY